MNRKPTMSSSAAAAALMFTAFVASAGDAQPIPDAVPTDTPIVLVDRSAAAQGVGKVRLTDDEREFAAEEERLLRQRRLLDLQLEVQERATKLYGGGSTPAPATAEPTSRMEIARQTLAARSGTGSDTPPAADAPAAPAATPRTLDDGREPLPFRLMSVWGAPGSMRAEFQTRYAKQVAAAGDLLPGGWVVESIIDDTVSITKGKSRQTLNLGK